MFVISWAILMKLGISAILGMVIGLEREIRQKPLGLKTSLVISVSSCLLTIVSIESAARYAEAGVHVMDPMRLAAQIVSGIGFLGAGVILRKSNDVILGLTTAAMIWAASGLGIAVGAGFFVEAIAGLILIIVSVEIIPVFVKWVGGQSLKRNDVQLRLIVQAGANIEETIEQISKVCHKMRHIHIRDASDGTIKLECIIAVSSSRKMAEIYQDIRQIENVVIVETESLEN